MVSRLTLALLLIPTMVSLFADDRHSRPVEMTSRIVEMGEVDDSPVSVVPLSESEMEIDLPSALRLAESQNPRISYFREIVCEAMAQNKEARALLLPTLTAGGNYHLHGGALQTSFGEIRSLNSQSLYVGGGAGAIGANTVATPAVRIFAQLGDAYFLPLAAQQMVTVRVFDSHAVENLTLLDVADRYLSLVAAEARHEALLVSFMEVQQIEMTQKALAKAGQGRVADAHRARSDLLLLKLEEQQAQEDAAVAAAELSRLLHLDPSVRLVTPAGPIELLDLVDASANIEALIEQACHFRPEVTSRNAEIGAAESRLKNEKMRPWLPLISAGFSGGAFGGGSDRSDLGVPSMYATTAGRTDFDVWAVWTVQNLGAGNQALQKGRRSERDQAIFQRAIAMAQIRREVQERKAKVLAQKRIVSVRWKQLSAAERGAQQELMRMKSGEALPIESLNSVLRLSNSRQQLLNATIEYNRAQLQLVVALGTCPNNLKSVSESPVAGLPESQP